MTTTANAGNTNDGVVLNTMNWDLVYATNFARINQCLRNSGSLPDTFQQTDNESGSTVNGQWGSWELTTGSPSNALWMCCTVASGSLQGMGQSFDISGSTWTVQFGLTWDTGQSALALTPATSGNAAPRVVAQTGVNVTGPALYVLLGIMNDVLQNQIAALGAAFMTVALNDSQLAPDQPWLVPTTAAFACESLAPGDPRIGVFAVLAMTEGRSAADNQAAVDRRVLDGAPDGSDAALVIGPNIVMEQLLSPAMTSLVQGSSPSDFTTRGVTVYNSGNMTWGAFSYGDQSDGVSTVYPRIPRGNIQLSLDGSIVHLSMANVNFAYPGWKGPGEITISFNTEQFIAFDFILRDDGGLVMVPQTGQFNSSCNVTIIPDAAVLEFQIALDATIEVLLAVIGGVVESATEAVTESATNALSESGDGGFEAEFDAIELDDLVSNNSDPEEIDEIEQESAEQGGEAVANQEDAGYIQQFKNAIIANKWKILMKILEFMIKYPVSKTTDIALWAAERKYDELPTLNAFAEAGISPVKWADGSSFTLTGGSLEGAIVLWGSLDSQTDKK